MFHNYMYSRHKQADPPNVLLIFCDDLNDSVEG